MTSEQINSIKYFMTGAHQHEANDRQCDNCGKSITPATYQKHDGRCKTCDSVVPTVNKMLANA